MYIKDTILKSLAMANMDPIITMNRDPLSHPSYETFLEVMKKERKTAAEAEALWKLLIDGFRHQRELNKDAQKEAEIIKDAAQFNALLMKYKIPEPLKSIYQENYIYFSEKIAKASSSDKQKRANENYMSFLRGVVRSTNPEFEQFANQLRALLIIPGGRELALWSGGIDLSIFSYEKSRCPLEQTVLGKLLNTMPITTLWNLEAPLWNIISRTFVSQYGRLPVHVYFRVLDNASVLLRQELPLMQKINPSVAIHWHPVFNYPIGMAEVGVHGEAITESGRGIDDMKAAAELLIAKLGAASYKANREAFERANSDYFDPKRPPFAIDD